MFRRAAGKASFGGVSGSGNGFEPLAGYSNPSNILSKKGDAIAVRIENKGRTSQDSVIRPPS